MPTARDTTTSERHIRRTHFRKQYFGCARPRSGPSSTSEEIRIYRGDDELCVRRLDLSRLYSSASPERRN